ncbi:hypothetical protein L1987_12182 [Smallanthus sonchifolius]|uniref:Uncharacterized protein n=1 Tax=Smallanthus sonchifolius TaxID=185202 RepID=A0ACB9JDY0_9ASTR|nr:hypothetical protein L1987_12182 [Smallanthus sonchifolius]
MQLPGRIKFTAITEELTSPKLLQTYLYNPDESIEGKLMPKKLHGVLVPFGSKRLQEPKEMSLSDIATEVHKFLQSHRERPFPGPDRLGGRTSLTAASIKSICG